MGVLVLAAGVYVAVVAGSSPSLRIFGWFLALVGLFGVAGGVLSRWRSRR
jgi:hypothetical protein